MVHGNSSANSGGMTEPRRISHNQLNVWWDCPTKWKYSYVDEIAPVETKGYYTSGILLHELMEVYGGLLRQGMPPGHKNTVDAVIDYAKRDIIGHVQMDEMTLYNNVLRVVVRYIKEFSFQEDTGDKILAVEYEFELPLTTPAGRDIILNGKIDQIRQDAVGGRWAMDFKSSKTGYHWNQDQLLLDSQLPTYAAVLRELGTPMTGVMVDSISTYPYVNFDKEPSSKLFRRIRMHRTDRELDACLANYLTAVDAQQDVLESGKEIPMHLTKGCVNCPFSEICLYRIKGIDTEFLIASKFKGRDVRPRQSVDPRLSQSWA